MTEIPNPLAQIRLVELCSSNWVQLQRVTARSPISLSRPVKKPGLRSLSQYRDITQRSQFAISRMPGGSVTLKTDVSQFYSSIYTHSVDWAVRGKASAKRTMRASGLGPDLDKRLRDSREGQTVGVSIGPDTSWLVSELVLARIDEQLCQIHPGVRPRAFRFIDDLTFYAESVGEAYDVLSTYERLLADFELRLNPEKVSVRAGLEPLDAQWVGPLRQARYRDDRDANQSFDLIDLVSLAFQFAREYPRDGVLSYAIKRCNPFPAGRTGWPLYRDFVIAAISQDGSVLRSAYQVLSFAKSHGLKADDDRLVEVLNSACTSHAKLDHGFEVSWILTLLRNLGLPLDSATGRQVALMDDNTSLVLLHDAASHDGNLRHAVDLNPLVRRAERSGALSTSDWLLAYELRAARACAPKKWDGVLQWKELHAAKVRFLVPRKKALSVFRLRRRRPAFLPGWSY